MFQQFLILLRSNQNRDEEYEWMALQQGKDLSCGNAGSVLSGEDL